MSKKKRKSKVDSFKIIIFLLLIFILILIGNFLANNLLILDKKEIYTSAILSDQVGFDLNTTALTFGEVIPMSPASRQMIIENNLQDDIYVIVRSYGNISDFLFVSENDFVLVPEEKRNITFTISFPADAELKMYDGKIELIFKRF